MALQVLETRSISGGALCARQAPADPISPACMALMRMQWCPAATLPARMQSPWCLTLRHACLTDPLPHTEGGRV